MSPIRFRRVERPLVTVAMVTYGAWEWASRSLEALAQNTEPVYEVVVVDNASPDGTAERLRDAIDGARIVVNERNAGFGSGVNVAAMHARGRSLCVMNSDALVTPGWLAPMLEVLERDPSVGAVLPCYLNLDGTVQEAGSAVDPEGFTVPIGSGADPRDDELSFPRMVDFGSAACMLVRRSAFSVVGGFDPAYGLGYYEDVDLCMELSRRGLRTVYEPRSRVVHVGAASVGEVEAARRSEANRPQFAARWGEVLAGRRPLSGIDRFAHRGAAARDAVAPVRVLVLTDRPTAASDGTARLPLALATLVPHGRITVFAHEADDADAQSLRAGGVEVARPTEPSAWLRGRLLHYSAIVLRGPRAAARYAELLDRTQFPASIVYEMEMDGTDGSLRPSAVELRAREIDAMRSAAAILCPSTAHVRFAEGIAPGVPSFALPPPDGPSYPWVLERAMASSGVATVPAA